VPQNDLVRVRAEDLEPGRRVRLDRKRGLQCVISVSLERSNAGVTCIVDTEAGAYVCAPTDLLDAEDDGEVWV
jgi:hypothetical protein